MLALLSRFLPHIIAVAAIVGAAWWFSHSRYTAGYEAAQAEMSEQVRKAEEATRQAEIESRKRVEAVDRDYQAKLQDLDSKYRDAVGRIGPVRVCGQSGDPREMPRASDTASSYHGGAAGDRLLEAPGERDIGPGLVELARLADKQTQQLVACQSFVRSLY